MSLQEKLDKIKSPRLQNQHQTAVVLSAVEDTLRDQKAPFTPTAYFAALLALLSQAISPSDGIVNPELATAVVYLLDVVTPSTPQPILRAKFSQILTCLAPALIQPQAEAPLLRSSIGCLESLLIAQDAAAWALPQAQIGPRRATAGLLGLSVDHRPKVRKRAQEALTKVLKNPPPSPSLDHPAADMCAETALKSLSDLANAAKKSKKVRAHGQQKDHEPSLMHAVHLVKTIAAASGGWPSRKIEPLCEVLLNISRSSHEYLTIAAFETFEQIFEGIASNEYASSKLPRLMEVISELRPSQNDSQLLPPWIAVLSSGYDVSAQINPEETFCKLPDLFELICGFMYSSSHNIRVSASECLVSFMANCVPDSVILEPSVYDQKIMDKLGKIATDLLSVKYQAAWMEVFNVLGAILDTLRWQSFPLMSEAVRIAGELRGNESFNGKKEADILLGKAVRAIGPEEVLRILPLNLAKPKPGQPGRAWLLPLLRDYVGNTNLNHFRSEFVPLSEMMFQRVIDHGSAEKTMEVKIFETLVQQIWALLPSYCDLPLDLVAAFDQSFAEMLSNLLYQQTELRVDLCKALATLVESNQEILTVSPENDDMLLQRRVSKEQARGNLRHLASYAGNLLAVLFNVYSQTLPHHRGHILQCVNAYLSIVPAAELASTFTRVRDMLENSLKEIGPQTQADKQKQESKDKMPPMSHTLMDLLIVISVYLPRESFASLFNVAAVIIAKDDDPQLQKKAYKLIPRLAESEIGRAALQERSSELQELLLHSADKTSSPARRDRLAAITEITRFLPSTDLHFIPSIISEVVISAKEVNEKARTAAFDLLVQMGEKMKEGGIVRNSKVSNMPDDAPDVQASLEEYFTIVSAGLAGSTPHMISASITALTRILYHFRDQLSIETLADMVQTMDLFLTSNNREIVRSVLGFVKVSVISLPVSLMLPRLETLIPNLMVWSHEHTAHFRSKVKHILERMIRRFGVEAVEKWCPEDDKKLITNIRKTRERRKRKKDAGQGNENPPKEGRKGRFESEYDEAVYGSDSDDGSDVSDDEVLGRKREKQGGKTFIVEDEEEPLDLLDRRALANISTTKPNTQRVPATSKKSNAKVNIDGKLIIGEDDDDPDLMETDKVGGQEPGDGTLEGGINAYIEAIKGKDAVHRGQRGKLKFSNKREKSDDDMDVDDEEVSHGLKVKPTPQKGGPKGRKGLGMAKTREGRVGKSPRRYGRR